MNLREAAEAALKAMSSFESGTNGLYEGEFAEEIAVLRAALAEPKFDCLKCGAEIYDGRNFPPSPYLCKKCLEEPVAHSIGDSNG